MNTDLDRQRTESEYNNSESFVVYNFPSQYQY